MGMLIDWLEAQIKEGRRSVGQILILQNSEAGFEMRHFLDEEVEDLEEFTTPEAARSIALNDSEGDFRPLKAAPNLKRGWRLRVETTEKLLQALDIFYPAAVGMCRAHEENRLRVTPLSETMERQTGMYRIVNRLSVEARRELVTEFCASESKCLRTILWDVDPASPGCPLGANKQDPEHDQSGLGRKVIPILCAEACNLLIAAGRTKVKANT